MSARCYLKVKKLTIFQVPNSDDTGAQSGKLSDKDRVGTDDDILHPRWAAVTFHRSTVASGKTSPVLSDLPGFSDKTERSRILYKSSNL